MVNHKLPPSSGGIRRGPRRVDRFTILDNDVINDKRLSYRARGVLIWLLSKPADWRTRSESIAAQSPKEGREAIRSAMRELREAGYLRTEKIQDPETGRWSTITTVFEVPVDESETSAVPEPSKPLGGDLPDGDPVANTKDRSPRTETNHNRRRQELHDQKALLSNAKASAKRDDELADLEREALAAGLPASFRRIGATQKTEILQLVDLHGVPALVEAAKHAHRSESPTMHAHGFLRLWSAMPRPREVHASVPLCGECVEGWIVDPTDVYGKKPAVRCSCRSNNMLSGGVR
ncbi:replication protein [Prescottella agglutinans]|uniref:Replication protein n=1 Tax=Prescottella agglutinans TaxID=1644129 RepID=A0ABT6M4T8_9NOCA|nr:replication protein [Prescottella agglutinans]MDH6279317.1 hypothetical protein [Prescottella agglutinans]